MESLFAIKYSYLIPLLPLLGAAIAGLFGSRLLKGQSHWPIWLGVGASAVLSISLLVGMVQHMPHAAGHDVQVEEGKTSVGAPEGAAEHFKLAVTRNFYTWIQAGNFKANAGFFIDPLTAVMLCVVTGIGFLITVFSAGYMAGEKGYFRFFAYLGLFIFMMTILVLGENFLLLYLGWEGVGLCSYLLIGYYFEKPAAREAAKKAFLVNRVGDFGFALGIMLLYSAFGTISFFGTPEIPGVLIRATYANLTAWQQTALQWAPFLLMLGAFGKSAQFPLYVWLPDAMEGPTPVSALIHAATMVTAGVYMIVRCSTLFFGNAAAIITIAAVGAFTAWFAATIALRQFDLKKVFAYSTISQLGFMFVGAAVLAPVAAIFHLVTHAFFKALLFLSSGVVMHAMAGELDMRKMSGLKHVLPKTRWLMLAGCLALAGVIPFSGFWSKDEIVIAAFGHAPSAHLIIGLVLLFTAFMTAYYTFRLYFRVFEGPEVIPAAPAGHHGHGHEAHEEATASASAIRTGTAPASGVDEHVLRLAPARDHGQAHHHNHEPWLMILPLVVLALGAVLAGFINFPNHLLGDFLGQSPSLKLSFLQANASYHAQNIDPAMFGSHRESGAEAASHTGIMVASILIAFLGILVAYLLHLKERARADQIAGRYPLLVRVLEGKFWVDEIYQNGIVEPLRAAGRFFYAIDQYAIDGLVWIIGFVPQLFGFGLKIGAQRGSLQGYALVMLGSVAVILLILFFA